LIDDLGINVDGVGLCCLVVWGWLFGDSAVWMGWVFGFKVGFG